ncbi:hypothetical protein GKIL_0891 [Gloeobacter kilaueensis JS1]|uniref:Uncharacterized protein n=1 Tax=Gloeobacter kilaueensis (strain ATCC BAA-2537 / CCAP 1431/1 / ULC 316 / JS1) TaxID=1183438 RepID=U5QDV1_GLOK1|nr:hypothetical protein GKIL_0891 [Gloeobacter kilaueensis JS1]
MQLPNPINQGSTYTWLDSLVDYPANQGWVLTYYFRGGGSALNLPAIASGADFQSSLTSAQTAGLAAGQIYWQAKVQQGSQIVTVGSGAITVILDLAAAPPTYDGQTPAQAQLAAAEAAIQRRLSGQDVEEYTVEGRSLRRMSLMSLIDLRDRLRLEVERESAADSIANGQGDPRVLGVMFGPPIAGAGGGCY